MTLHSICIPIARNRFTHRRAPTLHPVNTWLDHSAIAHEWPRLCQVVVPVSVPSWPTDAQLSPRRLGEDDAGVVQVHGAGIAPRAGGTPVPRCWTQGEFEAGWGGGGGRGRGEHRAVDGPGGGREVDRVMRLPLGVVWLVLVGGKKPQCGERPWMVLALMGRREAEKRQGDLGMCRLLQGTSRTGLTVGGLRGTGGLGRTLRDSCRLGGVGRSLSTIGLWSRKQMKRALEVNNQKTVILLFKYSVTQLGKYNRFWFSAPSTDLKGHFT